MLSPKEVLISNTKALGKCRASNDASVMMMEKKTIHAISSPGDGVSEVR